ncbi:protein of unknown function DUF29 [Xenococcus sp. PCC 7305]|uniref:DUF29 domain-containing protein n=1 Tax=Xenococcus sp. PCC 7305 TaxID=102125 RepID=UPI0002AD11B6|nr:DUF29 domain-containing protein [Xenococcus sp. PCC 7305]ELS04342.1 protein of unknown function DUF29 [Xenococcus sp. PCC 7305]
MTTQLPSTENNLKTLYEQDYCLWLTTTAKLLRERQLNEIDFEDLIEELEGMSRREKEALFSNLQVVLMHLLKYRYQPSKRSNSWRSSIREHRKRIKRAFRNSPSLKPYFTKIFLECYQDAKELAADETGLSINNFPEQCPFTTEEILETEYLPE